MVGGWTLGRTRGKLTSTQEGRRTGGSITERREDRMARSATPRLPPKETTPRRNGARPGARAAATPAERIASGRAARSRARRSAQAEWELPLGRLDPVDIVGQQDATR